MNKVDYVHTGPSFCPMREAITILMFLAFFESGSSRFSPRATLRGRTTAKTQSTRKWLFLPPICAGKNVEENVKKKKKRGRYASSPSLELDPR